jgi:futalosine hydrolase
VILLVAATEGELVQLPGTRALACGLGPVDAALATRAALLEADAQAVLHVGIAGARRGSGIPLLALVIGSESIYSDHRLRARPSPVATPDAALVAAACRALPEALVRPIATSGLVGGGRDAEVEAMEGYGVLRAAQDAGVPALEVRVVSNEVEEQDRANWMFTEAFEALHAMLPGLVEEVAACTS